MNSKITAIVLTDKESELSAQTVESLGTYADDCIDRAIVTEFVGQDDDYRFAGFSKLINQTVKDYEIDTDFLIITAGMLTTPESIKRMLLARDSRKSTGLLTGVFNNATRQYQNLNNEIRDYSSATEYSKDLHEESSLRRMTSVDENVILVIKDVYDKLGGFHEQFVSPEFMLVDYFQSLAMEGYNIYSVQDSIFWNSAPERIINRARYDSPVDDFSILKKRWNMGYFNSQGNFTIINEIDHDKNAPIKVLEIGCSKGDTLMEISEDYPNSEVYGAEISDVAVSLARNFCNAILNNIEEENLPYDEKFFDYIIFGDVLEHLHNPAKTLQYVKRFLKPDGRLIISVPNVQHISIIKNLINGLFTYTPVGLLDSTHIHLFTYIELQRMLAECGYSAGRIVKYTLIGISEEENKLIDELMKLSNASERFMFEAFQYVVKAGIESTNE